MRHKKRRKRYTLGPADIEILARHVHREDFNRQELADIFHISLKQLQEIIRQQGWTCRDGEDEDETNLPLPNPDPTLFVPCPYKAGSEGKIWFLSERYARRLPLWHPKDNERKVKQRSEDSLCRGEAQPSPSHSQS